MDLINQLRDGWTGAYLMANVSPLAYQLVRLKRKSTVRISACSLNLHNCHLRASCESTHASICFPACLLTGYTGPAEASKKPLKH